MKNRIVTFGAFVTGGLILAQAASAMNLIEIKGLQCSPVFTSCKQDVGPTYDFAFAKGVNHSPSGIDVTLYCKNTAPPQLIPTDGFHKNYAIYITIDGAKRILNNVTKQSALAVSLNNDLNVGDPSDVKWCGKGQVLDKASIKKCEINTGDLKTSVPRYTVNSRASYDTVVTCREFTCKYQRPKYPDCPAGSGSWGGNPLYCGKKVLCNGKCPAGYKPLRAELSKTKPGYFVGTCLNAGDPSVHKTIENVGIVVQKDMPAKDASGKPFTDQKAALAFAQETLSSDPANEFENGCKSAMPFYNWGGRLNQKYKPGSAAINSVNPAFAQISGGKIKAFVRRTVSCDYNGFPACPAAPWFDETSNVNSTYRGYYCNVEAPIPGFVP